MIGQMMIWRKVNVPTYIICHPLSTVGPGCYVLWQNLINSFELWHYQKKHGVR